MAVGVNGRVGVLNAGATAPATLPAYLASIGKASWYGYFRRGLGMFSESAGITPVTTFGASVGCWVPSVTAGGFSARFVQTTNSKRPSYMSVYGTSGIQGDATTTWLQLDSTTALNRDYTVFISATALADAGGLYSHNGSQMRASLPGGTTGPVSIYVAGVAGMTVQSVISVAPVNSTTAGFRIGWKSAGSSFYNTAPNLMRLSGNSNYTEACFADVLIVGEHMTPEQIAGAIPYLAL